MAGPRSFLASHDLDSVEEYWSGIWQGVPQHRFVWCVSHDETWITELGKKYHIDEVYISSHPIRRCVISTRLIPADVNLDPLVRGCLPGFSTVNLKFFPSHTLFFRNKSLRHSDQPTLKVWGVRVLNSTGRWKIYTYCLEFLCREDLALLYLFKIYFSMDLGVFILHSELWSWTVVCVVLGTCSTLGHQVLLQLAPVSLRHAPSFDFLSTALLSGITTCSRLLLYFPCPRLTSVLSLDPSFWEPRGSDAEVTLFDTEGAQCFSA